MLLIILLSNGPCFVYSLISLVMEFNTFGAKALLLILKLISCVCSALYSIIAFQRRFFSSSSISLSDMKDTLEVGDKKEGGVPSQPALQWFVGFSEGEACFKIKPKYRGDKSKVHSFSFEFEIHIHIDDKDLLYHIRDSLGVGNVYLREKNNSCSYIVGNEKGIRVLLAIFDKYKLNGIKYLDYLDFKKAFNLYFDRTGGLTDGIRSDILELYDGINTGRSNFNMPSDHEVKINPYWLLGLIEGEGSFYLRRDPIRPGFQILLTATQEPLLIKIKEYLENNLGFDFYSC